MGKQNVLIVGSSGHSKVIIDIFEKGGLYKIIGLLDSYRNIGENTLGYKILGKEEDLPELLRTYPHCKIFVAIGDNWVRHRVVSKVIKIRPEIEFATAIHPSAQIGKNVKIGKGVAIMPGVIINSDSVIGDFVILNTKASIDHDCRMAEYSSLGPDVTTGGNVSIGEFTAISIGSIISHGVSVGSHSVIGSAALLTKNCENGVVMYGVPAKKIRDRKIGEKYL
jgi:sugar O-acyltransferase (sialic acid O-acetyltransferase NeuD family)